MTVYLIGNRADLEDEREVTREVAEKFCKEHNIARFFETSAKTGQNVEDVFSLVAKELYLTNQKEESESEYSEYTEG